MAILAECGTLTSRTSTGTDTISLDSGIWGGASPKLLLMWGSLYESDGAVSNALFNFGAATSTSSRAAISVGSQNGVSTSQSVRRHSNVGIVDAVTFTGTQVDVADLDSFGANQAVIDWTTKDSTAYFYSWLALGGDDLSVAITQITSPTSTGTQAITGVGFQPDALIRFGVLGESAPASGLSNAIFSIGYSDLTTDLSTSFCAVDNQSTSSTGRKQSSHFINTLGIDSAAPAVGEECTVDSVGADGFTLDWTAVTGVARYYWVVSLKGAEFKLLSGNQPSTNTTASRTVGFTPKCALMQSSMGASSSNVEDDAKFGLGAWDSEDNQVFAGLVDQDGVSTTNGDRIYDSNEVFKHYDHTPSVVGSVSMAASGTDLIETHTGTDGTQREQLLFVMGDEVAAGGGDGSLTWPDYSVSYNPTSATHRTPTDKR